MKFFFLLMYSLVILRDYGGGHDPESLKSSQVLAQIFTLLYLFLNDSFFWKHLSQELRGISSNSCETVALSAWAVKITPPVLHIIYYISRFSSNTFTVAVLFLTHLRSKQCSVTILGTMCWSTAPLIQLTTWAPLKILRAVIPFMLSIFGHYWKTSFSYLFFSSSILITLCCFSSSDSPTNS